ncbi:MAG TPA: FecR domain-containing protein [Chitinophaga sp.]|uniref:FecR family protein n=1 Tax=Chitinophaga sp. TaxID=1869181 RepID=UPI002C1B2A63|nr:FecR domain-containing protein [Chitinophaga sp.]HVI44861.1 FecR domain-containing protein [Chitinophaga sp.]
MNRNDFLSAIDIARELVCYMLVESDMERLPKLKKWYESNNRNRTLVTRLSDPSRWIAMRSAQSNYNTEAALQRVMMRIEDRVIRRRVLFYGILKAVAVIVPLISIGLYYLLIDKGPEKPTLAYTSKSPSHFRQTTIMRMRRGSSSIVLTGNDTVFSIAATQVVVNGDTMSITPGTRGGPEPVAIEVPAQKTFSLKLPDGSKVHLNAGSMLSFDLVAFAESRELKIEGEAIFDVVHNEQRPFIINTGFAMIQVLGTRFNLKSYGDNQLVATLLDGKLQVSIPGRTVTLSPGYKAVLHNMELEVSPADMFIETAWCQHLFVFRDTPLREVLLAINRTYRVNIRLSPDLSNKRFSGQIRTDIPLDSLLGILHMVGLARFQNEGQNITAYPY